MVNSPSTAKAQLDALLAEFACRQAEEGDDSDLDEDMTARSELSRDIAVQIGKSAPLDQFL